MRLLGRLTCAAAVGVAAVLFGWSGPASAATSQSCQWSLPTGSGVWYWACTGPQETALPVTDPAQSFRVPAGWSVDLTSASAERDVEVWAFPVGAADDPAAMVADTPQYDATLGQYAGGVFRLTIPSDGRAWAARVSDNGLYDSSGNSAMVQGQAAAMGPLSWEPPAPDWSSPATTSAAPTPSASPSSTPAPTATPTATTATLDASQWSDVQLALGSLVFFAAASFFTQLRRRS